MLKDKKLFLLDIDGTVCKGKQLLGGVKEFLKEIKTRGGQFVFITNNATKSIADYIRMFQEFGIPSDYSNFITASYATVQYLKRNYKDQLIYVVGTKSFIRELKKNGINVTTDCEDPDIACALISYDNQLTYEKIQDTCELLSKREIGYLATNPDMVCPIEFGYVPDCGAICEMLYHAVKKQPYYIGKPEKEMIEYSLKKNHFTKDETLIVGDRMYTDILCGVRSGVETALVLTGEAELSDVKKSEYQPTYIFDSVEQLYKEWRSE